MKKIALFATLVAATAPPACLPNQGSDGLIAPGPAAGEGGQGGVNIQICSRAGSIGECDQSAVNTNTGQAVVGGTGGGDGGEPEDGGVAITIPGCDGVAVFVGERTFDYSGRTIKGYACLRAAVNGEAPLPEMFWLDVGTLARVSLPQAFAEDTRIFVGQYKSIDLALHDFVRDPDQSGTAIDVDVWFFVDLSDAPEKIDLINDPGLAAAWRNTRNQRIFDAATALAARISDDTESAAVVSVFDTPEDLQAPRLTARAKPGDIVKIGEMPDVWKVLPGSVQMELQSEDYYWQTTQDQAHQIPLLGDGITVAILEFDRPDYWEHLPGVPGGNCEDLAGIKRQCFRSCAPVQDHARKMMGLIQTDSTDFGGLAPNATTISAGYGYKKENCPEMQGGKHDPDGAIRWSIAQGASILSQSEGRSFYSGGKPLFGQDTAELYRDFVATQEPWPLIVAAAGNFRNREREMRKVSNALHNGIVIGNADGRNSLSRRDIVMTDSSYHINRDEKSNGWELPHVIAPGMEVSTAGDGSGLDDIGSGTSSATAAVSGIAAALMGAWDNLLYNPEVIIPAFLVGADESADNRQLSFTDNFDDPDGAGLVNAFKTFEVLKATARRSEQPPDPLGFQTGHDLFSVRAETIDEGDNIGRYWTAWVPPGKTLRVASLIQSQPDCPTSPTASVDKKTNCSPASLINHRLLIYRTPWNKNPANVRESANVNQAYQYARWKNAHATAYQTVVILISIETWNGNNWSYGGIAWTTE